MLKSRPIYCPNVILLDADSHPEFNKSEAVEIINKISKKSKLITVYIDHDIKGIEENQIVVKNYDYCIYKEIRVESDCIASKYLAAGSSYVYYINTDVENYRAAFSHIFDILSEDYPFICISKYLAKQLQSAATVVSNNALSAYKSDLRKEMPSSTALFTANDILLHDVILKNGSIQIIPSR